MQVNGSTPIWIAARALLAVRVDDFFSQWVAVQERFEPEEIHDLRVASRRLREGLTLFAPCYPPKHLYSIAKQVKAVTILLGEVRNTDEAILFFSTLADELHSECGEPLTLLVAAFDKKRKKDAKHLRRGLESLDTKALRKTFYWSIGAPRLFARQPAEVDPFISLSAYARKSLASRMTEVLELLPEAVDESNVKAQHRLRIAVKRFRYRMEILSFLIARGYKKLHETVKTYQDLLGKLHDLDLFAEMVRQSALSNQVAQKVLDRIGAKRKNLFQDFLGMLEKAPFEVIGEQVGSAL